MNNALGAANRDPDTVGADIAASILLGMIIELAASDILLRRTMDFWAWQPWVPRRG